MRLLFAALILLSGCSVVGPGQRGVRVSLGTVSEKPKEPGAYFWFPGFAGMVKMDVQIQKSQMDTSAASKDMQEITAGIAVNWSLSPEQVVKVYQEIGDEDAINMKVIAPAIQESLKSATAQRAAEECLTKRIDLKRDIDLALEKRLSGYGIKMHDVSITNLTFGKEFTDAIEQKQIAEQRAQQAKFGADKAIQDARAEVERAKGQNEAQKLLQSTTTEAILRKAAIDKWNGVLPVYMTASGPMPFIKINQ